MPTQHQQPRWLFVQIIHLLFLVAATAGLGATAEPPARQGSTGSTSGFDGSMSRAQLYSYLSRAATMVEMVNGAGDLDDHIRMITNTGMKYAGRSVSFWGKESTIPTALPKLKANADRIHAAVPDLILEGCSFEIVTKSVGDVDVPTWVFAEFGKPAVSRKFNYADMVGRWGADHWGKDTCIPDITKEEYQMWVYYLARNWIDVGCEAVHFGEMVSLCRSQTHADAWWSLLSRIRRYGASHARRHLVLCNAFDFKADPPYKLYDPKAPMNKVQGDRFVFDFCECPLRIKEDPTTPQEAKIVVGHRDAVYQRSPSGMNPLGWYCEHQPYLVEVDNWSNSKFPGQCQGPNHAWVWGYDEINWFQAQSETYRNNFLKNVTDWLQENDPNGRLQMPGIRIRYRAHTGKGNQEETIKAIWAAQSRAVHDNDLP
jgi:hypothetical protein